MHAYYKRKQLWIDLQVLCTIVVMVALIIAATIVFILWRIPVESDIDIKPMFDTMLWMAALGTMIGALIYLVGRKTFTR